MGQSIFGSSGMYRWLHRMGNKSEHTISEHTVKMLCWELTRRIFRSMSMALQTNSTLSTSKHSNKIWKGRAVYAMGSLAGGAQNRMVEFRIDTWTSYEPGGGAGISYRFTTNRSMGAIMASVSTASRYSCDRYSRNAVK
jgi:hypothetical protein